MFVYAIVNSDTLKIYIGQHKGKNLRHYLQQKWYRAHHMSGERSYLYASMRKHPRNVWSIHPLLSNLQTREECDFWEQTLIKALHTQHPDVGYNICRGGEGFTGPHTEEQKHKIGVWSKTWHASLSEAERQEQNRKISVATMGVPRPHSAEDEAKRQAAFQVAVAAGKTKSYGMLGKQHSETTLAQMSESAKQRGISPETHQKMLASRQISEKCRTHPNYTTPEGIEKMRAAKKGKPWSAARRAAYNKTFSSISG